MEQVKSLLDKLGIHYTITFHYITTEGERISLYIEDKQGNRLDGRNKVTKKLIELLRMKYKKAYINKGIISIIL